VPSYGVNLLTAPPVTHRLLETWVDFYRTYRLDLVTGKFDVFGSFDTPNHIIEGPARSIAFVRQESPSPLVAKNKSEIFILNATDSDHLSIHIEGDPRRTYTMTTLDRFMDVQRDDLLLSDDHGRFTIDAPVDQGAMIVLRPIRKTGGTPLVD
jgi:hypothetical protein